MIKSKLFILPLVVLLCAALITAAGCTDKETTAQIAALQTQVNTLTHELNLAQQQLAFTQQRLASTQDSLLQLQQQTQRAASYADKAPTKSKTQIVIYRTYPYYYLSPYHFRYPYSYRYYYPWYRYRPPGP